MKLAPPFPGARGFGTSRHKEPLPLTLVQIWFSSATRWPLFRASVPARSRFPVVKGEKKAATGSYSGIFSCFLRKLTHPCGRQVACYDVCTVNPAL